MKARLALVTLVSVGSIIACSGASQEGEEGVGSGESALAKEGTSLGGTGGSVVTGDAGVTDTGSKSDTGTKIDSSIIVTSPVIKAGEVVSSPSYAPCPPQRWDVVTQDRTCWDLPRRSAGGMWTVASLYPDAPAAIRNTRCAVTFIPIATATCPTADITVELGLSCDEMHATAMRSAECAADPAACAVSASLDNAKIAHPKIADTHCHVPEIDGGSGGGSVGGCDSCGTVNEGIVYITNPFNVSTVFVGLQYGGTSTVTPITGAPHSSFAVSVGSGYTAGPVSIWR